MGAFDESSRMGIDWDLRLRISLRAEFQFVDEVTYYYRVWGQQIFHNWRGGYRDAIRSMDKFLANYLDAVSREEVRRAWAHTFTNRGRIRVSMERQFLPGIKNSILSVLHDPTYVDGWKAGASIGLSALRSLVRKNGV